MNEKFDVDAFLMHYGVLGMKWGVRKTVDTSGLTPRSQGITFRADGSIDIKPGASIQRLARSNGKSMPLKGLTYASLNDYDNARYVKIIGGKGLLGGGRDQILGMTATKRIKAPSIDEATRIHSKMMLNDPDFRKRNSNQLGGLIGEKELASIRSDPSGKVARAWYEQANQKMTFDAQFDPDAPYVQKKMRDAIVKAGYNALRDENDVSSKVSKAPIIIFDPEKSVKITTVTQITDEVRKANKEKLKLYKKAGSSWLEKELYSN